MYVCVYVSLVCVCGRMCNELWQHELLVCKSTDTHTHTDTHMGRHDEQSVISKFPKGFNAIF